MTAATQAYQAYSARPFRREERGEVEILFGGLHWRVERVIEAVFENLGSRARALPTATKDDLLLGRELADIGQCCPTSFVTGNLANFLKTEATRIGPEKVAVGIKHQGARVVGGTALVLELRNRPDDGTDGRTGFRLHDDPVARIEEHIVGKVAGKEGLRASDGGELD